MCEPRFNPFDSRWRMMCPSLKAAAENRKRIREKYCIEYWLHLEAQIAGTPWWMPLPKDVPVREG
uniref:Uncharacterized protein n=1 Tax=viral metagenome TaxID=1070528 RepID=A0A6M3JHI4_9ZZZZ